jgi:hypothetical protein
VGVAQGFLGSACGHQRGTFVVRVQRRGAGLRPE